MTKDDTTTESTKKGTHAVKLTKKQPKQPTEPIKKKSTKVKVAPPPESAPESIQKRLLRKAGYGLAVTLWVVVGFYAAQLLVVGVVWAASQVGITLLPTGVNDTVVTTVITGIVYMLALAIVLLLPWKLFKRARATRQEMGLEQSLPRWRDLGLAPLVYVACFISTAIAVVLLQAYVPSFDIAQRQEIPFDPNTYLEQYELILVYITLGVLAPVFEELLFRGYLYGKLRNKLSAPATILVTAVTFSALHLGIGQLENLQWNVAVDTFILAIGLGLLRHYTNSVWASIIVHMIKNTVAFFVLFVLPRFLPMTQFFPQ